MDKKRALICAILLCTIGTIALLAYLIGVVALDAFPFEFHYTLPIWFIMFYGGALIPTRIYFKRKKEEKTTPAASRRAEKAKPEYGEKEFNEWLKNFEPFTKTGARLTKSQSKGFSKFGGLPVVPQGFTWPTYRNRPTPFLLQIDFSEVNGDGVLPDFPTSGLLYLFVNNDDVNCPDFERGHEPYAVDRTFKILFFDKADNLKKVTKPSALDTVYKEFFVSAKHIKTYPDPDDCEKAFEIYCDRPFGGMDDDYYMLQCDASREHLLGGWASYIQSGGLAILNERTGEDWTLLLQIDSESGDDKFMWGDCGMLYLFIRTADLKALNFDNVKFDMQCT